MRSLTTDVLRREHQLRCAPASGWAMAAKLIELVVLALLSAFLCGTAIVMGHITAAAIFAALAATIVVVAVGLRTFS